MRHVANLPTVVNLSTNDMNAQVVVAHAETLIRTRCVIHNTIHLLTIIGIGLFGLYQAMLDENKFMVRDWVAIFMYILTVLSDPRIGLFHEATAPVFFVTWLSLSVEWYIARSNLKVGCNPGDIAFTTLLWYLNSILSMSICFLIEIFMILLHQHGDSWRKYFRSLVARRRDSATDAGINGVDNADSTDSPDSSRPYNSDIPFDPEMLPPSEDLISPYIITRPDPDPTQEHASSVSAIQIQEDQAAAPSIVEYLTLSSLEDFHVPSTPAFLECSQASSHSHDTLMGASQDDVCVSIPLHIIVPKPLKHPFPNALEVLEKNLENVGSDQSSESSLSITQAADELSSFSDITGITFSQAHDQFYGDDDIRVSQVFSSTPNVVAEEASSAEILVEEIADINHPFYDWDRHCQRLRESQMKAYRTAVRPNMLWLAQWADHTRHGIHQQEEGSGSSASQLTLSQRSPLKLPGRMEPCSDDE
ncbi:hypothetical protein FBU30_001744 [Linnemannia zychae]|nr:hypothetical protein FBU30_001744 [Linnemannia zychae]